jgi:hypothetical protein
MGGGVFYFYRNFHFFLVIEGGQLGVNPSSHVFLYSITVFLPCGFFVESHRTAYNRTKHVGAPQVATTPKSGSKAR